MCLIHLQKEKRKQFDLPKHQVLICCLDFFLRDWGTWVNESCLLSASLAFRVTRMSTNSQAHDARAARRARRSQLRNEDRVEPLASSLPAPIPMPPGTGNPIGIGSSDGPGGEDVEDVQEDDMCPICRLLLYNLVTTTCNHTLCRFCMAQWASVSVSLAEPMTVVDVMKNPPPSMPSQSSKPDVQCAEQ
jgi:hypothetical protein